MGENNFEKFIPPNQGNEQEKKQEEKEKREMSTEEVAEMGEEMDGYLEAMLNRAQEIKRELDQISEISKEWINVFTTFSNKTKS